MALRENRDRPIVVIAGARRLAALYMTPALVQLARLPNVTIIPTIEEGPSPTPAVLVGRIEAHIPPLNASDIVYACGSPRMVEAVGGFVEGAGATFYADPFESAAPEEPAGLLGMLKTLVPARRNAQQGGQDRHAERQPEPRRSEPAYEADYSPAVMHSPIPLQPEQPRSASARQQHNSRPVRRERAAVAEAGHAVSRIGG
jgi:CDP-4-dehydro-6-deoxyglucose reductase, E3